MALRSILSKWMASNETQRGAILLTTTLIVAIMAALSVAVFDRTMFAVKRAQNLEASRQGYWYLSAAQEIAKLRLDESIAKLATHEINLLLQEKQIQRFPFEGGWIEFLAVDGGRCLSLNAAASDAERGLLEKFLTLHGLSIADSKALADKLADWIDNDNVRRRFGAEDFTYLAENSSRYASNTDLWGLGEIRSFDVLDERKLIQLRPYFCVRNDQNYVATKVNINSLKAQDTLFLASFIEMQDEVEIAKQIIVNRPETGYRDLGHVQEVAAAGLGENVKLAEQFIGFEPSHFWIQGKVHFLNQVKFFCLELVYANGEMKTVFKSYNRDDFRSLESGLS